MQGLKLLWEVHAAGLPGKWWHPRRKGGAGRRHVLVNSREAAVPAYVDA